MNFSNLLDEVDCEEVIQPQVFILYTFFLFINKTKKEMRKEKKLISFIEKFFPQPFF